MRIGPFKLIAFDLDGVLVDSSPCHAQAYEHLWSQLGVDGPAYDQIAGRRTKDVLRVHTEALKPSADELDEWTKDKQAFARELLKSANIVFDDARGCLERLVEAGQRFALGTAASRASAMLALGRLNATEAFEAIVTAEDVAYGKPNPEAYQRLFEKTRVSASEALVVEDSASGLSSALAAGAFAVSVRTGQTSNHAHFLCALPNLDALLVALGLAR